MTLGAQPGLCSCTQNTLMLTPQEWLILQLYYISGKNRKLSHAEIAWNESNAWPSVMTYLLRCSSQTMQGLTIYQDETTASHFNERIAVLSAEAVQLQLCQSVLGTFDMLLGGGRVTEDPSLLGVLVLRVLTNSEVIGNIHEVQKDQHTFLDDFTYEYFGKSRDNLSHWL